MLHLIANSGLQFYTQIVQFDPTSQYVFSNGKQLRYSFLDKVVTDPLFGNQEMQFDFLCTVPNSNQLIPLGELVGVGDSPLKCLPNGHYILDDGGVPIIDGNVHANFFTTYLNTDPGVYCINNLDSYKVKDSTGTMVSAFSCMLDKWLPMPVFEQEVDGTSSSVPTSWARLKITQLDTAENGVCKYRLLWAFDTNLANDSLSCERPVFYNDNDQEKIFSICNRGDILLSSFLFTADLDGKGKKCSNFADYIARLLEIDTAVLKNHLFKHLGFYIYLINYLRYVSNLELTLHRKVDNRSSIPVDMSLDIGNSRTCGVLFENGEFTKGKILELRDLTRPWKIYDSSFDMRVVFRKADFGNDIITDDDTLFSWKSILRVGEEAKHLIYDSLQKEQGLAKKKTNYSSPKRYLWDKKAFDGRWENLVAKDDPLNVLTNESVFVPGLTKQFDANGNFIGGGGMPGVECKYSRSSLMTFVFIEIFQQAYLQINSESYRKHNGNIDCRRYLRTLVITAPTSMPVEEQKKLRQCAIDANAALSNIYPFFGGINVVPTPDSISSLDGNGNAVSDTWTYDEATASQFVYLYAEIAKKYDGDITRFLDSKGKTRQDLINKGYGRKVLTIGSIDIGAGTTDLMICSYENPLKGCPQLKPIPLFWDSFYLAGDDILKNIILRVIIEGRSKILDSPVGIFGHLKSKLLRMTNEELQRHPSLNNGQVFPSLMNNIIQTIDQDKRQDEIVRYADNLLKSYFGEDSAVMSFVDRNCRADFNTQISMPIAQKMLELLRLNRPSKVYSFDEIFSDNQPAQYLLDHFYNHFGFHFEEIEWRYEPDVIADNVRTTMEPLMKQLSILLNAYGVDTLILAGRPCSLNPITELFVKYFPVSPDRLVRLNEYQVGSWYPLANPDGYFYDQKSVVSVGAMIGFQASSNVGFKGMSFDFSELRKVKSTAEYIGVYDSERFQVNESFLSPKKVITTETFMGFPVYLGCKRLDVPSYQARPLFAIYNNSEISPLIIQLSRDYSTDKEAVFIEEISDVHGNSVPFDLVELVHQSIADECFWLDNGVFKFLV